MSKEESNRQAQLLKEAAIAFEEGTDPFSTGWLSDHNVTLTECYDLGEVIGSIIKGYLASPSEVRTALHARAILSEVGLADLVDLAIEKLRVIEAMKRLNAK